MGCDNEARPLFLLFQKSSKAVFQRVSLLPGRSGGTHEKNEIAPISSAHVSTGCEVQECATLQKSGVEATQSRCSVLVPGLPSGGAQGRTPYRACPGRTPKSDIRVRRWDRPAPNSWHPSPARADRS